MISEPPGDTPEACNRLSSLEVMTWPSVVGEQSAALSAMLQEGRRPATGRTDAGPPQGGQTQACSSWLTQNKLHGLFVVAFLHFVCATFSYLGLLFFVLLFFPFVLIFFFFFRDAEQEHEVGKQGSGNIGEELG